MIRAKCSKNNLGITKKTSLRLIIFVVELVKTNLHSILAEVRLWRELIQYSYPEANIKNSA